MKKDTEEFAVDLGLPSGLKWARGNIVKNGDKYEIGEETDYGAYVSWGNIYPHFRGDGYVWGTSNSLQYSYTSGSSITSTFTANSGHDAARELLGSKWKMPTMDNFVELNDNCTSVWVTNYNGSGVKGRLFTSKINGATLFFPAAGYGRGGYYLDAGVGGYYWSRSLYANDSAYNLYFSSASVNPQNNNTRHRGYSVRAVQ